MNIPNSALAYFTPAAKPTLTIHRIHEGRNGTSSTTRSNDLVRWFTSGDDAKSYYRSLGFRVWAVPCAKYGKTWIAWKR